MARRRISGFDRVGVVIIALVGACLGLMIASARGYGRPSTLVRVMVVLLVPGVLPGWGVGALFGRTAGIWACGIANGAAYGFLMYAWVRSIDAVIARTPGWSRDLASRLRRH